MTSDDSVKKVTPILSDKGRSFCPYVKIIEQPASKAVRFRYECEGRSAGSIPGVNSTPENKTYPTIKVFGYHGRAVAVVSCVTKDPPHKPHPHSLIGKDTCEGGVYRTEISPESMTVTFPGLGIQCVKKKNIEEALKIREKIRVDPFNTGFEHKRQPINIDLNVVRLCFQVFIEGSVKGKFTVPLMPVVSNPIYDKKAVSDLTICKLSHHSASVGGGMEMVLLCEKIVKEDIQVRFFEERDGQVVWEGFGDFQPSQVHKQVAITFKTPPYHNQHIERAAWVYIQLMRPSDSTTSVALPFKMTPLDTGRPNFWFMRRASVQKKADPDIFNKIVATEVMINENRKISVNMPNEIDINIFDTTMFPDKMSVLRAYNYLYNIKNQIENQNNMSIFKLSSPNSDIVKQAVIDNNIFSDNSQISRWVQTNHLTFNSDMIHFGNKNADDIGTSSNELWNQVDELDQIYADTHSKIQQAALEKGTNESVSEDDCDNQTYTSFQMAMKNPVNLLRVKEETKCEDLAISSESTNTPVIPIPPSFTVERDMMKTNEEKIPPLPPKRLRKMSSMPVLSETSKAVLCRKTPCGNTMIEAPYKNLPSIPSTQAKFSKPNLLKKLFMKKNKKYHDSLIATNEKKITSEKVSQDRSSISPYLSLSSVDREKSYDSSNELASPHEMELNEAEHYALYTTMAPHATISEFDDMSFYYSTVEDGKILTEIDN